MDVKQSSAHIFLETIKKSVWLSNGHIFSFINKYKYFLSIPLGFSVSLNKNGWQRYSRPMGLLRWFYGSPLIVYLNWKGITLSIVIMDVILSIPIAMKYYSTIAWILYSNSLNLQTNSHACDLVIFNWIQSL